MTSRWSAGRASSGDAYQARFDRLAASGVDVHGEADLVSSLKPRRVFDAGCGTGRVALELARRGVEVVGVDSDPRMLDTARRAAPSLWWVLDDLVACSVEPGTWDVVVAAGNVMIFLEAGTEAAVVDNLARHLRPGGRLVAGFQLGDGRVPLAEYDAACDAAGLGLEERFATWDRRRWNPDDDYAVSVHTKGLEGGPGERHAPPRGT